MQCASTNAVLRFVAEDNSLCSVPPEAEVALQVLRFDRNSNAVVCRSTGASKQAGVEHAPRFPKRPGF